MVELLTDEVWAQLDPHAGRLSRRQARRMWAAVLACLVLAVSGLYLWRAGLVVPRVERDGLMGGFEASVEGRGFSIGVPLMNNGQLTETVVGVGASGPGLTLLPSADTFPRTLAPHTGELLILRYAVTDCAAVPAGDWPVPVRVSRPWGTVTVHVAGPTLPPSYPATGSVPGPLPGGAAEPWQRVLARQACALPG